MKSNNNIIRKLISMINNFGKLNLLILILYSILVIVIATNHELSQDETQAWLIARDLNFIDIIKQMQYEGHSFLWHFIIAPFAKLGFSVNSQKIITCFFSISTVFMILKKSPFKNLLKVLLVFSSGMIYYYSAFARPYCMIPFLLACIAINYEKRKDHPYRYAILVGLLANTHLIMLPTSVLLMITFWGEELIKNKNVNTKNENINLYKSLIIVISLISVYVIIAIISYNSCQILANEKSFVGIKDLIYKAPTLIKGAWLDTNAKLYGIGNNLYGDYSVIPMYFNVIIFFVLILCAVSTLENIKQGVIFWGQYIFMLCLHAFCWFTLPTRIFIIIYTLMFWVWTYKFDEQYKKTKFDNIFIEGALIILIIVTIPGVYKCAY